VSTIDKQCILGRRTDR